MKYLFAPGLLQLSSGFMRLPCYVSILCSCILSRKEQMRTPICVSHYKNILHITTGNSIQQVDVLFAYVRHVGCVRVTKWMCSHQILLSDDEQFFCICFPSLPLCLLCRSQVTCRKDFESNRANPKKTHMIWAGQEISWLQVWNCVCMKCCKYL